MKNILLIARGNFKRVKEDKLTIIMVAIVLPIIVGLGVYFSNVSEIKGKIAIINPSASEKSLIENIFKENKGIKVESLDKNIKNTSLITGAYLAEIDFKAKEDIINKYSNSDVKEIINHVLKGEPLEKRVDNGDVVKRICGYLLMFLFYGTLSCSSLFLKDRDTGIYSRVLSSNVSFFEYILGQIKYMVTLTLIPSAIVSLGMIKILNVDIGMSYLRFFFMIFLISLLCTSIIILISSIWNKMDEIQMNGSIIGMLTSLFSGCLISVEGNSKIIETIRNLLPQKRLLDFIEKGRGEDLIFVLIVIASFIIIGTVLGYKKYKNGTFN